MVARAHHPYRDFFSSSDLSLGMNYLRGAVNAISAPYQYYKELPPINPSTLTGAIDVIVIQHPSDNGGIELACSPFHVRFGKWQVLRPSEKKVNVSVNGHPIPFNMKIGEAGEAFFVFETEDDVPDDLITSPILQPVRPDEATPHAESTGVEVTSLVDEGEQSKVGLDSNGEMEAEDNKPLKQERPDEAEPEFFDLDAQASEVDDAHQNSNDTPRPGFKSPVFTQFVEQRSAHGLPSPPPTPQNPVVDLTPEMAEQERRVDEALWWNTSNVPNVDYPQDLTFDAEGYHSHHDRERSDRTIRTSGSDMSLPDYGTRPALPSPASDLTSSSQVLPMIRATSEPPPDFSDHVRSGPSPENLVSSRKLTLSPVQEYSWEWGAFPQPSPAKLTFGKAGRWEETLSRSWNKGKAKAGMDELVMEELESAETHQPQSEHENEHGRSRSVPPELEGSPSKERKKIEGLATEDDTYSEHEDEDECSKDVGSFGRGGTLKASKKDPTRFILQIEGQKVAFELSIASSMPDEVHVSSAPRAEISKEQTQPQQTSGNSEAFVGCDDVESARLFGQSKISFQSFLEDGDIINDPRLVVRWAGTQYITQGDDPSLMRALSIWRDATLQPQKKMESLSHPTSPLPEDSGNVRMISSSSNEQHSEERHHHRSKSEPPEKLQGKTASTSWTRWLGRSLRKKKEEKQVPSNIPASKVERPGLRETASAPVGKGTTAPSDVVSSLEGAPKEIPPAESAPAYPSSPIQKPVHTPSVAAATLTHPSRKKFAKTLRLSSDQLKSLNLKAGSNTITFSLSASGAIAATARIFVWSSADSVVVSDIDGTITKSDGLGHVFAMIGRDWTHLGVAKLYTDITRNGYKIMYLTSRAIGQADATRDYLKGIKQNDYQLPEGPVIMSPDRLMASLHREVIMRKPEVFKMACLRDILRLFGETARNPFYAGFGNRITDALSYRSVNVPSARIFTIDSSGEVKMELLELAGYKSSYIHMTDLVDQMFPPINRKVTPEFTDFNFWKMPVREFPLPDLSPPSPALSARSDSSTLARLRNFRLVPSRQGSSFTSRSPSPGEPGELQSSHNRQISSLEKLSNTLGLSKSSENKRSTSPESSHAFYESEEDDSTYDMDGDYRRTRRRSMTSMPGTLDEMHFGMDEDDEVHYDEDGEDYEEEVDNMVDEGGDEAFVEDLLAAGEMKNVPFL